MSFKLSCAKLSSEIVEILSAYVCTDIAKYIMRYVNIEKDVIKQLNSYVIAETNPTMTRSSEVKCRIIWRLASRRESYVNIEAKSRSTSNIHMCCEDALDFADRFRLSGHGKIVVWSKNGKVMAAKW
jgi:hypothetical protein